MKLFIPAVGYRIKLTADWQFLLHYESRNDSLFKLLVPNYKELSWRGCHIDNDPARGLRSEEVTLPAGTLLEVDRVYVRNANKARTAEDDYDSVTFKVLSIPERRETKRLRFWAKLTDVNQIEYELPPDFTRGKTQAQERAKQPKKLNNKSIMSIVADGLREHVTLPNRGHKQTSPRPKWLTDELLIQLKKVEVEHQRIYEPYERESHELARKKYLADLEFRFNRGEISIPIALAGRIKTFDDYLLTLDTWSTRDFKYHPRDSIAIVCYDILSYGVPKSSRLPDGAKCRTYRENHEFMWGGCDSKRPRFDRAWVKVYSDANDVEITKVEVGFDPEQKEDDRVELVEKVV